MNALFNLCLSSFRIVSLLPMFYSKCILPPSISRLLSITNCAKKAMLTFCCYFSLPVWFGSGVSRYDPPFMVTEK